MLNRSQYLLLCLLGALSIGLAAANGWLFGTNRSVQAEVNARAAFLQQTVALENLYREIAKALADMALKNNDTRVLGLLAAQGITVTPNATPPDAAARRPDAVAK